MVYFCLSQISMDSVETIELRGASLKAVTFACADRSLNFEVKFLFVLLGLASEKQNPDKMEGTRYWF